MDVEKELINYGLDDKEAKIYYALLQVGKESVFNIAKKSEIKRTTAYVILKSLVDKGLVGTEKTRKALLYFSLHPKKLLTQLEQKKRNLEEVMPAIMAVYNTLPEKPSIQIYEGIEAMKELYKESFDYMKKRKEIVYFGDAHHLEKYPELINMFIREMKNKSYNARELLPDDNFHREYARRQMEGGNPKHKIRFLPKDLLFLNDNGVYDNRLIIYSTQKELFAIVIESEPIARTYKSMFEMAWQMAKG
ncbi:MAG: transcriptional regulator TrmB [Candidatus Nomurabacteria bacterium]|nr:transcriptional regulator TrmB [Candidatus Nomurabacteria bacterium]